MIHKLMKKCMIGFYVHKSFTPKLDGIIKGPTVHGVINTTKSAVVDEPRTVAFLRNDPHGTHIEVEHVGSKGQW